MDLLLEGTVLLIAAVIAVPIFQKLGLGATLGYLAAGVVVGPHLLGVFEQTDALLDFAKVGVLLLLFLVGLDLAPGKLLALKREILGLGSMQVVACAVPIGVVAWAFGLDASAVVLVALGLAFSSTAFALQALGERGELGARHGQAAYAILLFKYLSILPLMAAIPLMGAGLDGVSASELVWGTVQTVAVILAIIVGGHFALRPLFRTVASHGATETFTAAALLVVLGTAAIVQTVGLDMALGAFLAGVLLADSEYRHEIHASIEPFKGLLLGLFFMAVGMSADLGLLASMPVIIVGLAVALVATKLIAVYGVGRVWGLDPVGASKLSAALPQGGELAFVLFSLAAAYGVMGGTTADAVVAIVTLSMAATPLVVTLNERLVVPRLEGSAASREEESPNEAEPPKVIIIGFGRFGQLIGRILHSAGISFTALELDPKQVDFVRRYGHRIYYADASRPEVLRAARISEASAVILAIDDAPKSTRVAEAVRQYDPQVPLYAVARHRHHAWQLQDLRTEAVVREAFATSLELGEKILEGLGWTPEAAQDAVQQFRGHDEEAMAQQYALYSERGGVEADTTELAHELENLFEHDTEDPIRPTASDAPGTDGDPAPDSAR